MKQCGRCINDNDKHICKANLIRGICKPGLNGPGKLRFFRPELCTWHKKLPKPIKKPKRAKLPPVPKLEKRLDAVFELYIRYRDNWTCCCCGVYLPLDNRNMHAGHYEGRANRHLRHDEKNVNGQCKGCNGQQSWKGGLVSYTLFIIKKYGKKTLVYFDSKKGPCKRDRSYYTENIEKYTKILNERYKRTIIWKGDKILNYEKTMEELNGTV